MNKFDYEEFSAQIAYERDYPKQFEAEKRQMDKSEILEKIKQVIAELEALK